MTPLTKHLRTALAILLGERCVVCGHPTSKGEVCENCKRELPYINIRGEAGNPIERLFWGVIPVAKASSTFIYRAGSDLSTIVGAIKYHNQRHLARQMGRIMANELYDSPFFDGIEALLPIPLHTLRQRHRGYNQSEWLAKGISDVTGIPIVDIVTRTTDNTSQTRLMHNQRRQNVEGIFRMKQSNTAVPRHVLIVDDVITTGATIRSCAAALPKDTRISILSLAYAGPMHLGRLSAHDLMRDDCTVDNTEFRERQARPLA